MKALPQPSLQTISKQEQVCQAILQWIEHENLAEGARILSQNQLARVLGFSPITVHRALASLEKEGILERIRGKGTFVRQRLSKGPARQSGADLRQLCLVLPGTDLDDPAMNPIFWPYVQNLIRQLMLAVGDRYHFVTYPLPSALSFEEIKKQLRRYDLLLFANAQRPIRLMKELIWEGRQAVASLGLPEMGVDTLTVDHDRIRGSELGTEYLLELGYRRIGFVGDSRFWGDLSYSGFERAMRRHGGMINESWLFRSTDIEQMAKAATDFVCENPEQIEVFFCDADVVAMSLLRSLTRVGLKVPDQIGVMSYDGIDFYTQQPPYLTSVRIPYLQMIQTVLLQAEANEFRPFGRQHHFLVGEIFRGQTVAQKE